ncbi:MAG: acyltransferase [Pseudomonadota bacterium]
MTSKTSTPDPAIPPGTLASRISSIAGPTSGFDYLRLVLALGVVVWHSIPFCYGPEITRATLAGPAGPIVWFIVPGFFAVSGFLVIQSLERTASIRTFLAFRFLRIFPALAVVVLVSALVLGALLTSLPLQEYYSHPDFFSYFANIAFISKFELPGVFQTTPEAGVNGSLWTIPFEMQAYVILAALSLVGLLRFRFILPVILFAGAVVVGLYSSLDRTGDFISISVQMAFEGPVKTRRIVLLCFLAGVTLYIFRKEIPYRLDFAIISAVMSFICLRYPATSGMAPIFIAYLVIWLGLQHPPRTNFIQSGDYSYGTYLVGAPIQQTVYTLALGVGWRMHWLENLIISLPIILLLAVGSWRFVEKPALSLKKQAATLVGREMSLGRNPFRGFLFLR